ncbi:MAG: alpha/beta hydrolase [Rhodospirillales bacterium CG15_BIG_FIL_POST_REV_8_21_14_020_66_15]|nr:MAG: alpha/beta hydrolase [Rhodospirillales bacterium CG15_BIG_FIL_POST_REV_8_21_14_020_66_15]
MSRRRPGRLPALALCGFLALGGVLAACAVPLAYPSGPARTAPHFMMDWFVAADGIRMTVRRWTPKGPPRAVVVALHGFNDYSNFFDAPGAWLAERGVLSYAYDQRGFGDGVARGLWAGTETYARDLADFVALARRENPGVPVYVLGDSMGGAVAMAAATGAGGAAPDADGMILAAPAVWGRAAMAWYERMALWLTAHTVPTFRLTAEGLDIRPSDNIEMLRALGRDWRVIKRTRVETVHGLVGLMDTALAAAPRFSEKALILYGEKDEVIPGRPTFDMVRRLPAGARARQTFALYEGGYHMLLRDLNAETVWRDVLAWIEDARGPLPSGADRRAARILAEKP